VHNEIALPLVIPRTSTKLLFRSGGLDFHFENQDFDLQAGLEFEIQPARLNNNLTEVLSIYMKRTIYPLNAIPACYWFYLEANFVLTSIHHV
jgi:hypothetical protein